MSNILINANSIHIPLAKESVQCCVTSPPYFKVRDYHSIKQIGRENLVDLYINNLKNVFAEVYRILKDDGTLWIVIDDTYERNKKNLLGIPWLLAFSLKEIGYIWRSTVIYNKTRSIPESVKDRPTKSHEYVLFFSKNKNYYYDYEAMLEPLAESSIKRLSQDGLKDQSGSSRVHAGKKTNGNMKAVRGFSQKKEIENYHPQRHGNNIQTCIDGRNKRSVWNIAPVQYAGNHFAIFPPRLILPMILSCSKMDDVILDPFVGTGTTIMVANQNNRLGIGLDINFSYLRDEAKNRVDKFLKQ